MHPSSRRSGHRFNASTLLALAGSLLLAVFAACSLDKREVGYQTLQPGDGGVGGSSVGAGGSTSSGGGGSVTPCANECAEVVCPPDDVCRDYEERIAAGSCNGSGSCASVADCSFSWKPVAPDGVGCDCGADGCRLSTGLSCTGSESCASANCLASNGGTNLCCAVACAPNEACSADGSGCEPLQACTDGDRRCSGSSYQQCAGQQWTNLTECGTAGCSLERGGCLRIAGQACEADADCGEGSCLETGDGSRVCCTAACSGQCQRCAASGTECAPLEDDPACGVITCPSDDPCRLYVPSVESQRCLDGRCATPEEACTFTPQNQNRECNPTTLCDGAGNCSQPKRVLNDPCSDGVECLSGACVASEGGGSVCCDRACAANELCGPTGSCVLAPVCEDGDTQCSGSTFQRCNNGQWSVVTECGTLGCDDSRGGCLGAAGDTCGTDDDCGAGRCLPSSAGGSVCCTAACDGACRRCAPSGIACANLNDDAACPAINCPASTTCQELPGRITTNRCVSGRCGSAAQLCIPEPQNAGAVCSATNRCDNAGNCSLPLLAPGSSCTNNAQCAGNNCVNGTCCSSPCGGACQTCSTGVCQQSNSPQCAPKIVECNGVDCAINGQVCCAAFGGAPTCVAAADCGTGEIPITCDDHLDCNPGVTVCCRSVTDGITVSCVPAGQCDAPSFTGNSFEQLCGSPFQPQTVLQCPAGSTCTPLPDSRMIGWSFCQ